MNHMYRRDASTVRQDIGLAFAALSKAIEQLFESNAHDAHPGVGVDGDPHLQAIAEPDQELFERLAGLASSGLAIIESDREWFLTMGLAADRCYEFWYRLALTVIKAADGRKVSGRPAPVPDTLALRLFHSLLRFLPYACAQPGDCAIRTADALILLHEAFPLEDMRQQLRDAEFSASSTLGMLSAVAERVRESNRANHIHDQDRNRG